MKPLRTGMLPHDYGAGQPLKRHTNTMRLGVAALAFLAGLLVLIAHFRSYSM